MQSEVMDLGDKVFKSSPFARKTMKISAYTSDEAAESVSSSLRSRVPGSEVKLPVGG